MTDVATRAQKMRRHEVKNNLLRSGAETMARMVAMFHANMAWYAQIKIVADVASDKVCLIKDYIN